MKILKILSPSLLALVLFSQPVRCEEVIAEEEAARDARRAAYQENLWFPVGENLKYTVLWGIIPVAVSTASSEWITQDGRDLIRIRFRTRSNKVLRTLYPVDDLVESIIDPETFLPLQFTKKLSEGKYRAHEITTFDFERLKATWRSELNGNTKEYDIDPDTRDLIAFMYFMRSVGFEEGVEGTFQVMADEQIYDLHVKPPFMDKVKLAQFGNIPAMRIDPEASFEGIFVRTGTMRMWVSTDPRFIMCKLAVKVPVAHVNIVLTDVSGPGDDFWIRKEKQNEKKRSSRRRR